MKLLGTFLLFTATIIFFNGCSQYKDPELAKKIQELESKEHLDEFDQMELKDLKEQAKYGTPKIKACKTK